MTILPPGADLVALYNEGNNTKAMNVVALDYAAVFCRLSLQSVSFWYAGAEPLCAGHGVHTAACHQVFLDQLGP